MGADAARSLAILGPGSALATHCVAQVEGRPAYRVRRLPTRVLDDRERRELVGDRRLRLASDRRAADPSTTEAARATCIELVAEYRALDLPIPLRGPWLSF